jgi:hypothetical protein
MAWVDQRDVAVQHLALASEAIERARADGSTSPDALAALEELRATVVALAKVAGVTVPDEESRAR